MPASIILQTIKDFVVFHSLAVLEWHYFTTNNVRQHKVFILTSSVKFKAVDVQNFEGMTLIPSLIMFKSDSDPF